MQQFRGLLLHALLAGSFIFCLAQSALAANPREECDPQLFREYRSEVSSDAVAVSMLRLVTEKNFEEFRRNFGASISIPIFGVPVDFGATWSSFDQKRREYLNMVDFKYDMRRSRDFVDYKFSDNSTNAYVKCIESVILSAKGLHLAWGKTATSTPTLIITWLDTASEKPPTRNVDIKIKIGGTITNGRVPIYSGGRQTLIIERDSQKDTTISANILKVDSAEIDVPADPIVHAPPPPEQPVAFSQVYMVSDSSHTLSFQSIFQTRHPSVIGYTVIQSKFTRQPMRVGVIDGCNAGYLTTDERLYGCATLPYGFLLRDEIPDKSIPVVTIMGDNNICRNGSLATADTSCSPHSQTIGWLLK